MRTECSGKLSARLLLSSLIYLLGTVSVLRRWHWRRRRHVSKRRSSQRRVYASAPNLSAGYNLPADARRNLLLSDDGRNIVLSFRRSSRGGPMHCAWSTVSGTALSIATAHSIPLTNLCLDRLHLSAGYNRARLLS